MKRRGLNERFAESISLTIIRIGFVKCICLNGKKCPACVRLRHFCYNNKYGLDLSWKSFYDVAKEATNSDPNDMENIVKAQTLLGGS
ncbi:MAG TPA: hypothetical protein VNT20_08015 [Flavisolibacter sp.]|jgi:hypothetical protein|nr:hypothetical protein [Flavisolibacter sp.]